ncbi:HAMP domain-containing protein [Paenibacillus nanensis]|uniref:HAMP domain-containing protein n=1 Tax=Paenibacillus nanensis TaxID=393251 RepID=A0A3A1VHM8_9BACL|nr:histidine kinase [Paenibacillus nanensis]RIX59202.1 HAMP domain-containing protein [Paenibacillus nanensis]
MFMRRDYSLRNTIFLRLVVTFTLIMLPIVTVGVSIYQWSIRTASNDISKTAVSQISFYLNDLENEIERMKLLQYGFLEDADLNKLALTWETMGDIERMESITLVLNRAFTLQNSSHYIRDVSVHIRPIQKTLSSLSGAGVFKADRYEALRAAIEEYGTKPIVWNGNIYLSAAKQSGLKEKGPLFIIEIELDSRKLEEALQQFNTYTGSGSIMKVRHTGFLIGSKLLQTLDEGTQNKLGLIASGSSGTIALEEQRYFVSHAYSERLDTSIYRFIPEDVIRKPLDKFYARAWLFAAGALIMMGIYALSTYKFIHKPLLKLVKGFRRLESGDLEQAIAHDANDEFRYIYERFNQMVVKLRTLIDQAWRQKVLMQRAELKQLQSQINPHFLYNSFFIMNTMAKTGDTERIEMFTTLLGDYFQFVTRNASDDVTLKQEVHHARTYADIQELRFYKRIEVYFEELPEAFERLMVPRLIVQPIIENAFEHSLEKKARNGRIEVRFERCGASLCIIVEDNGDSLSDDLLKTIEQKLGSEDEFSETTGIVNIHRRLVISCGEGSGIRVSRGDLGGLKVTIRIPLKEGTADAAIANR